jgi:hypothetical protein
MCVEANIVVDMRRLSFGVVGIENPEFREVAITNTSLIPVRLAAKMVRRDTHFKPLLDEEENEYV